MAHSWAVPPQARDGANYRRKKKSAELLQVAKLRFSMFRHHILRLDRGIQVTLHALRYGIGNCDLIAAGMQRRD